MSIEINKLLVFVGVYWIRSDCLAVSEIYIALVFKRSFIYVHIYIYIYIYIFLDKFIDIVIY